MTISSVLVDAKAEAQSGVLLETAAAAARIHVKGQTLSKWRIRNFGPPFLRISSKIFYRVADLDAWLEQCRVVPSELKPRPSAPRRSHHKRAVA
jgi:hypothetical protein